MAQSQAPSAGAYSNPLDAAVAATPQLDRPQAAMLGPNMAAQTTAPNSAEVADSAERQQESAASFGTAGEEFLKSVQNQPLGSGEAVWEGAGSLTRMSPNQLSPTAPMPVEQNGQNKGAQLEGQTWPWRPSFMSKQLEKASQPVVADNESAPGHEGARDHVPDILVETRNALSIQEPANSSGSCNTVICYIFSTEFSCMCICLNMHD